VDTDERAIGFGDRNRAGPGGPAHGTAGPRVRAQRTDLGIEPARNEVLIRHENIKGFMPAMTMPFTVKDAGCCREKNLATW
jgi:hypothetical protein